MMSVTLEKVARNVPMDLLFNLTKRQENRRGIASPVLKVTIELSLLKQIMHDFEYCRRHHSRPKLTIRGNGQIL